MLECILALQKYALKHKGHKHRNNKKHGNVSLLCGNVVHGHKISDIYY